MIGTVTFLFGGFFFLIWNTYRRARKAAAEGEPYTVPGKIRWEQETR